MLIQTLIILVPILVIVFIIRLLIYINDKRKQRKEQRKLQNRLTDLKEEIHLKEQYLIRLQQDIEDYTPNNSVNLTTSQNNVLDLYERSNIRIPADIIEDLAYSKLKDENEIQSYIDNQRYYWKLENTKKVFKGGK